MLELCNLSQSGSEGLAGISARLQSGAITTVLGRTGAGKTSLLRAIAGLDPLEGGEILFEGRDLRPLPPWRRPVAMVTQQFINYPHLSALENVAFPLRRSGVAKAAAHAAAEAMLARVGLGSFAARRPGELSGGQQQRVAIARALVREAPVLLLDEPFVNLDYKLREALREELLVLLQASPQTTVLYATTDPREALQMGQDLLVMEGARILQSGPPRAVFTRPATLAAARVITDPPLNILPLAPGGEGLAALSGLGAGDLPPLPEGAAILGLRADALRPGGPLTGEVILSEMSGSETVTHLWLAGLALVMWEREVIERAPGSSLALSLALEEALIFDAAGRALPREGLDG